MRCLLSILLFMLIGSTHAEVIFPSGCKAVVVEGTTLMLSAPKPLLVMMNNLSDTDIWITHPVSDPSASAGWSTRLQAGKWSALTLADKTFELSCIESKPGHEQQIPCQSVLAVCQMADLTFPAQAAGTYWAGEGMNLPVLIAYLERRGYVLPTSSQ